VESRADVVAGTYYASVEIAHTATQTAARWDAAVNWDDGATRWDAGAIDMTVYAQMPNSAALAGLRRAARTLSSQRRVRFHPYLGPEKLTNGALET